VTTTEVGAKNLECSMMQFYWLLNTDFPTVHPIRSYKSILGKKYVTIFIYGRFHYEKIIGQIYTVPISCQNFPLLKEPAQDPEEGQ